MDYGHAETEKKLRELENRIRQEYQKASSEVFAKMQKFSNNFTEADKIMREKVLRGEITQGDLLEWRQKQLIISSKWYDMRMDFVDIYMHSDEVAQRMINDFRYDTYAANFNYGTYEIEKGAHLDTSFALYDKDTVKRLIKDNPDLLPPVGKATSEKIRRGELKKWNKQQLQSVMTQSVLQGESIPNIAKRLAETVSERNCYSHIRAARTMATSAQNAGRFDAYKRAESMGIKVGKTWLAVHDNRTRHSHRIYDGMTIPLNEEFAPNLMFPADPDGDPSEVYNCRCTMVADVISVDGVDITDITRQGNWEDNWNIDYEQWKSAKLKTNKQAVQQEPKTFKEKVRSIKNDPTLSTEEKIMQSGKLLADDINDNYLKPLQDECTAAEKELERIGKQIAEHTEKADKYAMVQLGMATPADVGLTTTWQVSQKAAELADKLDELRALQISANDRVRKAKRALDANNYEKHARTLADKLAEVRPVGGINMKAHLNNSRSPMRKHVEYAYDHYPTDWLRASIGRGKLTPKKVDRGYYSDWEGIIAISGWNDRMSRRTSFHELGHRFERVLPEARTVEKAFYERRTKGEQLEWLGAGYAKTEKARKDKFISEYMGKDYGGTAYELMSMGFEYAYTDPAKLAKDPDMQQWIYGILLTL